MIQYLWETKAGRVEVSLNPAWDTEWDSNSTETNRQTITVTGTGILSGLCPSV